MKKIYYGLFSLLAFGGIVVIPQPTFAASTAPSCALSVVSDGATTTVDRRDTILVRSGSVLGFSWTSRNATNVTDGAKRSVGLTGTATTTVVRASKYLFTATRGSARAYCGVSVVLVSGSITSPSVASSSKIVTLAGKARGVTSLKVSATPAGGVTPTVTATARVRSGSWTYKLPRVLPDGVYAIETFATKSGVRTTIATSTLTVGNVPPAVATTLVVVPVPLLVGGIARANTAVAVTYLQVINVGTATATVSGITLSQTGTAPVAAVVQLSAVTDNGLARGVIGTPLTGTPFVGQVVTVPINFVLAPKEMRLVTVKAVMAPNLLPYLGTKLTLMVSGLTTNARVGSTLPLFGTIWTVGY